MTLIETLGYDPRKYKTAAGAAKGLYRLLREHVLEKGMNPDIECFIHSPSEAKEHGYVKSWHVCWESGPYGWAIGTFVGGPWGYCETYWGFDLVFNADN